MFATPAIRGNHEWFEDTLMTLLEIAYPNSEISGEAISFAQKLHHGIKQQLSPSIENEK